MRTVTVLHGLNRMNYFGALHELQDCLPAGETYDGFQIHGFTDLLTADNFQNERLEERVQVSDYLLIADDCFETPDGRKARDAAISELLGAEVLQFTADFKIFKGEA